MSKPRRRIFFALVVYCLIITVLGFLPLQAASLPEADGLYQQGQWAEARAAYDALLDDGQVSEALLLRCAEIAQKQGDVGGCIYYLKQLEGLTGAPINEIRVIQTKLGLPTAPDAEATVSGGPGWAQWLLLAAVAVAAGFATVVLFARKKIWGLRWRQGAWAAAVLAVGLGTGIALRVLNTPQRAVVVRPVGAYLQPSYAMPDTSKLGSPFTQTVDVLAAQDIWRQVRFNGRTVWVPDFTLRLL